MQKFIELNDILTQMNKKLKRTGHQKKIFNVRSIEGRMRM